MTCAVHAVDGVTRVDFLTAVAGVRVGAHARLRRDAVDNTTTIKLRGKQVELVGNLILVEL